MCEVNRFRLAAVQNKITYILFLMVKYYIRQVSLNKIFVQLPTKLFFMEILLVCKIKKNHVNFFLIAACNSEKKSAIT